MIDSTLYGNIAGAGGAGGGLTGTGGPGGNGGGIAVAAGPGRVRNATVAGNGVGTGGAPGSAAGTSGAAGVANCVGSTGTAIADGGRDLSYGDQTCLGRHSNPELGPLQDNGGPTATMAIGAGSAAINAIPAISAPTSSRSPGGVQA